MKLHGIIFAGALLLAMTSCTGIINQKEDLEMSLEYRIEEMDSFRVVGIKMETTNEEGKGYQDVPGFWQQLIRENKQLEILPLMDTAPYGLLGINVYNTDPSDARKFDYYIACASTQSVPEGMAEYTVSAYTWAVFPCKQAQINEVMVQIVTDWLPGAEYELVNTGYETGYMEGGAGYGNLWRGRRRGNMDCGN